MRGSGSGKGGVRFGEERGWTGRRPSVAARRCVGRGGGGGLLEEGEGEGAGVGRAGWEAEAQEE
jgi:hypothetical protein